MSYKERLSATVDPALIEAAEDAVRNGRARSVSSWVAEAMQRYVEFEERLAASEAFFASFEAEFGPISVADQEAAFRDLARRSQSTLKPGETPKSRVTPKRRRPQ
jgi:hypothetical protein